MNNTKNVLDNNSKLTESIVPVPNNFDNNTNNVFSFSELLKDGAKQGVKAIKLFALMILLFGVSNMIFFAIHMLRYLTESQNSNYNYTISALIVGFGFLIIAFILTYKYLLINTIEVCYSHLQPFFQKVCTKVIDLVISGGNKLTGKDIHKSLNVGSLMIEVYGKKLPKYVQKGLMFALEKIPFGDFLQTMHSELNQKKDNRTLSYILYIQLDKFISESMFGGITLKWIYWLLPLNIIIQIILIYI